MFTGIVRARGQVSAVEECGGDSRISFRSETLGLPSAAIGDSIAVNGVCLTAVELQEDGFAADVSAETLALTTLGELRSGDSVNLEPALSLQTPLGGHLVSGHVDGVGQLVSVQPQARSTRMLFDAPAELARYIARKGSVCIDGVSLTVNDVDGSHFGVNIVPHTLEHTIMGGYSAGSRVNIEVDLVARYLERLLQERD